MKMQIEFKASRWLVNGKRLEDMNQDEKDFIDDAIRELKAQIDIFRLLDEQREKLTLNSYKL